MEGSSLMHVGGQIEMLFRFSKSELAVALFLLQNRKEEPGNPQLLCIS